MKRLLLLAVMLLGGCATAPTPSMLLDKNCAGVDVVIRFEEYLSAAPTIDCAIIAAKCGIEPIAIALMVAQVPIACTIQGPYCSAVVLPIIGADLVREHEYEHLVGKSHPPFLPFMPACATP